MAAECRAVAFLLVPAVVRLLEVCFNTHCEEAPEVLPGAVRCVAKGSQELVGGRGTVFHLDRPYQDKFLPFLINFWGLIFDDDWRWICRLFQEHPGLTFLDGGANYGAFALPVAQCQGAGRVVAVEASPVHVALLEASAVANHASNRVAVFPFAVGNSSGGKLRFAMPPDAGMDWHAASTNQGRASAVDHGPSSDPGAYGEPFESPVTTIDDIYHEMPKAMKRVLVMKMDIEGSEGWALQGARQLLTEAPPCFCKIELDGSLLERAGTSPLEVVNFLGSLGYVAKLLHGISGTPLDLILEQEDLMGCIKARSQKEED